MPVTISTIHPKSILNRNFPKSYQSITTPLVDESFWNFAQSTAVILLCSVQNFRRIHQLKFLLWTYRILQDFCLRSFQMRPAVLLWAFSIRRSDHYLTLRRFITLSRWKLSLITITVFKTYNSDTILIGYWILKLKKTPCYTKLTGQLLIDSFKCIE